MLFPVMVHNLPLVRLLKVAGVTTKASIPLPSRATAEWPPRVPVDTDVVAALGLLAAGAATLLAALAMSAMDSQVISNRSLFYAKRKSTISEAGYLGLGISKTSKFLTKVA